MAHIDIPVAVWRTYSRKAEELVVEGTWHQRPGAEPDE
jgi:hypothetical protein